MAERVWDGGGAHSLTFVCSAARTCPGPTGSADSRLLEAFVASVMKALTSPWFFLPGVDVRLGQRPVEGLAGASEFG